MPLDRHWIAAHVPHAGNMCLLDEVLDWDASRIQCRSSTHRAADNPLRSHGRLGSACGIEYAAQAMALHGVLSAPRLGAATAGYLAGVRAVVLYVVRLDDIQSDLFINGDRMHGDDAVVMYDFCVRDAARKLLAGRATIVLSGAALPPDPTASNS